MRSQNKKTGKLLHGRYWYLVDNLQICPGKKGLVTLCFALPINHPGQRISNIKMVPEPAEIVEDTVNGNRILVWQTKAGAEPLVFYYDFDIQCEEVNIDINPGKIMPCDENSSEFKNNTRSEGWLDINREIRGKALEITAGETNNYLKAKKIFGWVSQNLNYEYVELKARGASKTLKRLKGDCGEFSALFVSLCRASQIPARPVTANWLQKDGHQWAEVYLPPYGWVPVDPTIANVFRKEPESELTKKIMKIAGITTKDPDWFFGNLYPNRIIVLLGENIKVISTAANLKTRFFFLQPGGQEAYPSASVFKGLSASPVEAGIYVFGENRSDFNYAMKLMKKPLAESYFGAKLYNKAEIRLLETVKENRSDSYAWFMLGRTWVEQRKYKKAIDAFNSSIAGRGGSLKPVWDALAHFYSGNCYDAINNRPLAKNEYRKAIASKVSYENLQKRAANYLKTPFSPQDI